jgi:hypothetical protein
VKLWFVSLLLLCCSKQALQQLTAQSAAKALTKLTPAWAEEGPPTKGLSSSAEALLAQIKEASPSLLALWRVTPHDPAINPNTQMLLVSVTPLKVQLDNAPGQELIFLLQTYSGELFVLLFSQTEVGAWASIDSYRLPALARRESCRVASDGVIRLKNIQATSNAPAFLWVEVQASNQCAELQSTERTLHLLALQGGLLQPTLEIPLFKQSKNQAKQSAGEQLMSQTKLDSKQNTLLLSGVRRMFPALGGEAGQESQLYQWYYFDGTRYQKQK